MTEAVVAAPGVCPIDMTGESAEIARKQPDGMWTFIIDSPWGLA